MTNGIQYDEFWMALQLCDSSFPSGSLAISSGLESAIHHGVVKKGDTGRSLENFVKMSIEQSIAMSLPFVRHTHDVFVDEDNDDICIEAMKESDEFCHSSINNLPARRSSTNQGKCFFRIVSEAFESKIRRSILKRMKDLLSQRRVGGDSSSEAPTIVFHGHYWPIFGALSGLLKLSADITDRIFLRLMLRDLFSCAARLNIIGPLEGARMQFELGSVVEAMLEENKKREEGFASEDEREDESKRKFAAFVAECLTETGKTTITDAGNQHTALQLTNEDDVYHGNASGTAAEAGHDKKRYRNDDEADNGLPLSSAMTTSCASSISMPGILKKPRKAPRRRFRPAQTAPILEFLQSRHDVLYTRLFNS